jgi:hypothetical protein
LFCINFRHLEIVFSWRLRMFPVRYELLFRHSCHKNSVLFRRAVLRIWKRKDKTLLAWVNISDLVCPVVPALTEDWNCGQQNSVAVKTYRRLRPGATSVAARSLYIYLCVQTSFNDNSWTSQPASQTYQLQTSLEISLSCCLTHPLFDRHALSTLNHFPCFLAFHLFHIVNTNVRFLHSL